MRSFAKIKPSPNGEINLPSDVSDEGKACTSNSFLMSQICLLALFRVNEIFTISFEHSVLFYLIIVRENTLIDAATRDWCIEAGAQAPFRDGLSGIAL